ncbi:MAG: L-2-amino-thiazoline-4-carboxylic acid hydrolase [Pseudomonadota bacterium]
MVSPEIALTTADRLTLRRFRKTLPKRLRASFDQRFNAVMEAERPFTGDPVTKGHVVVGACALSLYRVWRANGLNMDEAKARARSPMIALWRRTTRVMMWVMTAMSKDPFEAVRRYSQDRTATAFGPSFEIGFEETLEGFVSEVTMCGYRSFLMRHGAEELLDLFCEWDRTWIDALPRAVRFHRPPTQAQGGATCRFEFRRNEEP